MKNCYEVQCKGGHVGKGFYYPMFLYIEAEDKKQAVQIAKDTPRVKHDHKDCIQNVRLISRNELLEGKRRNEMDGYFHAHSKQEMMRLCPDYMDRCIPETWTERQEAEKVKAPLSFKNRKKYLKYVQPGKQSWQDKIFDIGEEG